MKLVYAFAALMCVAITPVRDVSAQESDTASERLANEYGFEVDIPECAEASKNIREIAIDELNIDIREMTTGLDVEYRLYGPGQAHWGQAKFTSACTLGGSKELQAWFQEAAKGKNIRKNITVTLFKSDKTPGRSYTLHDCFPTSWREEMDEQNAELVESLWVAPTHITFNSFPRGPKPRAEATSSDKFAQVRGFKVDIASAGGKEVDTAWESVSGGEMIIELTETTIGSDKFKTNSPGHKTVGEITLRGAMTDKRQALCTWINDTTTGTEWKRNVGINEVLPDTKLHAAKSYNYHDCFPIRYVFPRMSVYNQTGYVQETVHVKAIREPGLPKGTIGKLDIPGCPVASASALAVAVDDRALDTGLLARTGSAQNPDVSILIPQGSGGEIEAWYQETLRGIDSRKKITISFDKKQAGIKKYVLIDCFPVSYTKGNTTVNTMEEVTVKPIRVELK